MGTRHRRDAGYPVVDHLSLSAGPSAWSTVSHWLPSLTLALSADVSSWLRASLLFAHAQPFVHLQPRLQIAQAEVQLLHRVELHVWTLVA